MQLVITMVNSMGIGDTCPDVIVLHTPFIIIVNDLVHGHGRSVAKKYEVQHDLAK